MSVHTDIADAVVAALNAAEEAGTFSPQSFTASRAVRPANTAEGLETLDVRVLLGPTQRRAGESGMATRGAITRGKTECDYAVDVAVQKRVTPDSTGEVPVTETDPLLLLQEQIGDLLARGTLATTPAAHWVRQDALDGADAGYSREDLAADNLFLGVVRLWYRAVR